LQENQRLGRRIWQNQLSKIARFRLPLSHLGKFHRRLREFRDVTYPLVKQAGLREFG